MPSNPNKYDRMVRNKIEELLTTTMEKYDKGINYNSLVWELLKNYDVSESWVDRTIKRFFIDRDIVELKQGFLFVKKPKKVAGVSSE